MPKGEEFVTARISPRHREILKQLAEREDRSFSSIIRRGIELYAREALRREIDSSRTNPSE